VNEIRVIDLIPLIDARLIELLRSLTPNEWERPATPKWRVKEIAGHLLDGNLRRLSMARDGYWGEPFSGNSLVDFLNQLNADWVRAMKRVSPQVLTWLLELSNRQVADYFRSLDPEGQAVFAVSWAGEEKSKNGFDIAREYTEKWHHQQQIRDAVGRDVNAIMSRELYYPVLETFMRALPHGYRQVAAAEGATVAIRVSGDAGGSWHLRRRATDWGLTADGTGETQGGVTIPQALAWKLFTKGLSAERAQAQLSFHGDEELTSPILKVVAIVG
jgi:uncharacterized protein (TIGR03083 family)